MEGKLSSLETAVNGLPSSSDIDSSISDGLSDLQAQIDALQTQLDTVASEEDLNSINSNLDEVNQDLEELLQSSNVFSGNITISSDATLEFAEALGNKLAIVNGDVKITIQADMDNARVQAVANKMKTITGNLSVRAAAATVKPISFDSLVGVSNLMIVQSDYYKFPMLASADEITLSENFESRIEGMINFEKLAQVKSFQKATIDENFAVSSAELNTISFRDMTTLKLGSLPYYSNAKLTILGDEGFDLDLGALKTVNSTGQNQAYTLTITGASELNNEGIVLGTVVLKDVATVNLAAFTGTVSITGGVENLTLGALSNDLSISDNDLEMVDITLAKKKDVSLTNCTSLLSVTIGGTANDITISDASDLNAAHIKADADMVVIKNNDDMTELTSTGKIGEFYLQDCDDVQTVSLEHTNSMTEKDGRLVVEDNNNLTSFSADQVNNLETLTIQGNSDLTTISFDALKADNTGTDASNVKIGGDGEGNDFNASSIVQTAAKAGTFSSSSGINDLKALFDDALEKSKSNVHVYFDTADRFTYGTTDRTNLKFATAADQDELTVINRAATKASDASKSKIAVVLTTFPTGGSTTIVVNGSTLPIIAGGGTVPDFVSALTSAANISQASNNNVTLTANAWGSPAAHVNASVAPSGVVTTTTASKTASAEYIILTIGDYSSKLYLMTTSDGDFTADPIDGTGTGLDKTAERQLVITSGTTTISTVFEALVQDFSAANTSSPYTATVNTAGASATINIVAKDISDAHHNKAVKITTNMSSSEMTNYGFGSFSVNNAGTTIDDKLQGTDVMITFESIIAGSSLSTVGNPPTAPTTAALTGSVSITLGTGGVLTQLSRNAAAPHDQDDSTSVTNIGAKAASNTAATVDRTGWL